MLTDLHEKLVLKGDFNACEERIEKAVNGKGQRGHLMPLGLPWWAAGCLALRLTRGDLFFLLVFDLDYCPMKLCSILVVRLRMQFGSG